MTEISARVAEKCERVRIVHGFDQYEVYGFEATVLMHPWRKRVASFIRAFFRGYTI
jgi:hypothetical protein